MAIRIVDEFPGKTAGVVEGYPHGKARDVSAPNDGTGTPLAASLVNDDQGFKQALLEAAGITPNGTPDEVGASQYLEALKMLFLASGDLRLEVSETQMNFEIPVGTRKFVIKTGAYTPAGNPGETSVLTNFERAFPTKCLTVLLTRAMSVHSGNGDGLANLVGAPTKTSFTASLQVLGNAAVSGLRGFTWIAVGY